MRVVHISTIHRALDVRIFHKECKSLVRAGYDVHLIIFTPPFRCYDGVHFHGIKVTSSNRLVRFWQRLCNSYKIALSLQANIYHFHDPELIIVGIILKLTGAKVVYDVHEDSPKEAISLHKESPLKGKIKFFAWTILEKVSKLLLDGFVCATPTIAKKFPDTKVIIAHNFPLVSESLNFSTSYTSYGLRNNNIIYIGGISAIRGICEMVNALSLIPSYLETRLLLLGEFSSLELQADLENMLGWEKVDFQGWQSRDTVIQVLGQAKVALILFYPEQDHLDALPNKLFEYMAAGLPIVASDFPLWRNMMQEIGCGLLVNPLEPATIAQAIQYLLQHPAEAEEMGTKGQEAVKNYYNWDTEAIKLLELYKSLE